MNYLVLGLCILLLYCCPLSVGLRGLCWWRWTALLGLSGPPGCDYLLLCPFTTDCCACFNRCAFNRCAFFGAMQETFLFAVGVCCERGRIVWVSQIFNRDVHEALPQARQHFSRCSRLLRRAFREFMAGRRHLRRLRWGHLLLFRRRNGRRWSSLLRLRWGRLLLLRRRHGRRRRRNGRRRSSLLLRRRTGQRRWRQMRRQGRWRRGRLRPYCIQVWSP